MGKCVKTRGERVFECRHVRAVGVVHEGTEHGGSTRKCWTWGEISSSGEWTGMWRVSRNQFACRRGNCNNKILVLADHRPLVGGGMAVEREQHPLTDQQGTECAAEAGHRRNLAKAMTHRLMNNSRFGTPEKTVLNIAANIRHTTAASGGHGKNKQWMTGEPSDRTCRTPTERN